MHPRTLAVLAVLDALNPRVLAVVPDDGATNASRGRRRGSTRTRNRNRTPIVAFDRHRNVRLTLFTDDRSRVVHRLDVRVDDALERSARPRRGFLVRRRDFARRPPTDPSPRSMEPTTRTRPRSIDAVDHPSIDANRRDGVDGSYSMGIDGTAARFGRGVVRWRRFEERRATDEDGEGYTNDAATDASFTLALPEEPRSIRTRASRFSPRAVSTRSEWRFPTAFDNPHRATTRKGGGGPGGGEVFGRASRAPPRYSSGRATISWRRRRKPPRFMRRRVESSRVESSDGRERRRGGLADGRRAFRVRDDGGAKNATLTAILDVSRGWRRLDDIAARAGSNPVRDRALFMSRDDSAATFRVLVVLESIAPLVSGDDAGNLGRARPGAGSLARRASARRRVTHLGRGRGTFLTAAPTARRRFGTRRARTNRRVASRRSTSRLGVRAVVPLDVHGDGRGGGAGGRGGGVYCRWRRRRRSRVHSPTPAAANRTRFRDHPAPRCEALFPAAPGRGALERSRGPAAGALSCVFVRSRIQRGTNPENPGTRRRPE